MVQACGAPPTTAPTPTSPDCGRIDERRQFEPSACCLDHQMHSQRMRSGLHANPLLGSFCNAPSGHRRRRRSSDQPQLQQTLPDESFRGGRNITEHGSRILFRRGRDSDVHEEVVDVVRSHGRASEYVLGHLTGSDQPLHQIPVLLVSLRHTRLPSGIRWRTTRSYPFYTVPYRSISPTLRRALCLVHAPHVTGGSRRA